VAAAIHDELKALPADVRGVLESAAVVGGAFEPDLVAAVAGAHEPVALAAIDRLLEADLVRPTDAPRRFRFRHPIVRRAVYEGMPAGSRIIAHARAATALEAAGAPIATRAHHVERSAASGDEDAIVLLVDAARAWRPVRRVRPGSGWTPRSGCYLPMPIPTAVSRCSPKRPGPWPRPARSGSRSTRSSARCRSSRPSAPRSGRR
jgi:hypothetical protein